jgi:hypothetical protein
MLSGFGVWVVQCARVRKNGGTHLLSPPQQEKKAVLYRDGATLRLSPLLQLRRT